MLLLVASICNRSARGSRTGRRGSRFGSNRTILQNNSKSESGWESESGCPFIGIGKCGRCNLQLQRAASCTDISTHRRCPIADSRSTSLNAGGATCRRRAASCTDISTHRRCPIADSRSSLNAGGATCSSKELQVAPTFPRIDDAGNAGVRWDHFLAGWT